MMLHHPDISPAGSCIDLSDDEADDTAGVTLNTTSRGLNIHPGANVNITVQGQYVQFGGDECQNLITIHQPSCSKTKLGKLLDKTKISLDHWVKNDGKLFLSTPAFQKCRQILKSNGHVNIFGLSGQGKTTLAMKLIQESARRALILRQPEDWEEVDVEKDKPIVVLDDIFGKFELDKFSKDKWLVNVGSMYSCILEGKLQVVATCRETIFTLCENELGQHEFFKENSCIHLGHKEHVLTPEMKLEMVTKYVNSELAVQRILVCENPADEDLNAFTISHVTLQEISNTRTNLGFPQCCRLFVTRPHCFQRGVHFYNEPVEALILEIDRMRDSDSTIDKYNYCSLACVLLFGELSDERLDDMDSSHNDGISVENIGRACRLNSVLPSEIRNAARRLSTSYLMHGDETYTFEHNSITQAMFTSFSKCQPKLLIEHCDIDLLYNLITTRGTLFQSEMLYILPQRHYSLFSARLLHELTETDEIYLYRRLWKVVSHRVMSDTEFVDRFWAYVDDHPRSKFKLLEATKSGTAILFVSGRVSFGCFVGRLVESLRQTMSTEELEGEMGRALYGACVYDNHDVCEYLTTHHKHWTAHDISNALWQACHDSKFRCYKSLIEYDFCNKREVVTPDVLMAAAKGARSTKNEQIVTDLRSRGFELPLLNQTPNHDPLV